VIVKAVEQAPVAYCRRRCTARINDVKIAERVATATCDPGTVDSKEEQRERITNS